MKKYLKRYGLALFKVEKNVIDKIKKSSGYVQVILPRDDKDTSNSSPILLCSYVATVCKK